jgi:hypothetical protein
LPARYRDHNDVIGNLGPDQPGVGFSDFVVERGLPLTRQYDPVAELARIRRIYAVQAALPVRRAGANTFHHRTLRKG